MLPYNWTCHACKHTNDQSLSQCSVCDCPTVANAKQIDYYKEKYQPGSVGNQTPEPFLKALGKLALIVAAIFLKIALAKLF